MPVNLKKSSPLFLLLTLGLVGAALLPAQAASKALPCSVGGQIMVLSGKTSVCFFLDGRGTWTSFSKRAFNRLTQYEKTKFKAYSEIQKAILQGSEPLIQTNFRISSSFPGPLRSDYIEQTNFATRLFNSFLVAPLKVNVYFQTEKDKKFIAENPILNRDVESFNSWFESWAAGRELAHNIGLAAWFFEFEGKTEGHTGVLVGSQASRDTLRLYSQQVVAHEYFHVIQDVYKYDRDRQGYKSKTEFDAFYPPIFREGSANTISIAVSMKSFEDYLLFYQIFLSENKGKYAPAIFNSLTSNRNVIDALNLIELKENSADAHWASYSIGALTFEWLIAEYGLDGYKKLIYNQALGKTFEENLKFSLGITTDQLYQKSAAHIVAGFKAAKGSTK